MEIQLPHLFHVINLSFFFFYFVLIFYKGRTALFFRLALPYGHVLLAEMLQMEGRKNDAMRGREVGAEKFKRGQIRSSAGCKQTNPPV